ncbi:MAG: carbohydrate-binding protein [Chitinivibrionales bacterium]|nr:carbohydrate-binding protein [Chitinivibrionales bacterium]
MQLSETVLAVVLASALIPVFAQQRGRPKISDDGKTIVSDRGTLLRAAKAGSGEGNEEKIRTNIKGAKEMGLNTVKFFATNPFDSKVDGWSDFDKRLPNIDTWVKVSRELGVYLSIVSDGDDMNYDHEINMEFWRRIAPRYADETHVLYEIYNEGDDVDGHMECWEIIRQHAPEKMVIMLTPSHPGNFDKLVDKAKELRSRGVPFNGKEAIGWHGYGWACCGTIDPTPEHESAQKALKLHANGFPSICTEIPAASCKHYALLEAIGISWYPHEGVDAGGRADIRECVESSDYPLCWEPDYGTYPCDLAHCNCGDVDRPPVVTIISPSNNATFSIGEKIFVEAGASDDGSMEKVTFSSGGSVRGEDTDAPYTYLWSDAPAGSHDIVVQAFDNSGQTSQVSITVNVIDPNDLPGAPTHGPTTPFHGGAMTVPGIMQAEDFDLGGEGNAYHDSETGNTKGKYRLNEDVDIDEGGSGYMITSTETGEWLVYTIQTATAGTYPVFVNAANGTSAGSFTLFLDGENITGPIAQGTTGGYQQWERLAAGEVTLSEGAHELVLKVDQKGYIFDYLMIGSDATRSRQPIAGYQTVHQALSRIRASIDSPGDASIEFFTLDGRRWDLTSAAPEGRAHAQAYIVRIQGAHGRVIKKIMVR